MFVGLSWRPIDGGVVVVTAPQCGQTAPPCRNAEAEPPGPALPALIPAGRPPSPSACRRLALAVA